MGAIAIPRASDALHARLAHDQMLLRRRHDAKVRLSHEHIKNLIRALLCGGLLVALLVLGIFTGWVPLPGRPVVASHEAPVGRSADRFVETRTGQILIPTRDNVFCQQVLFNNETGRLSDGKTVRCQESAPKNPNPQPKTSGSRNLADALRDGFLKRQ